MKKSAICVILTVITVFGMIACRYQLNKEEIQYIKTASAEKSSVYDYVIMHGRVKENERYDVYSDISGIVTDCFVSEGEEVYKGQVLMTIEPSHAETNDNRYGNMRESIISAVSGVLKGDYTRSSPLYVNITKDIFGRFQLLSPCSGTVMVINSSEGKAISPVYPCMTVSNLNDLSVSAEIEESLLPQIANGMECTVRVDAVSEESIAGHIKNILPYATVSATLTGDKEIKTSVEVAIDNSSGISLYPGYSARVNVITDKRDGIVLVPYEAIGQNRDNKEYVLVLQDGKIEYREVAIGKELSDTVEVTSGLKGYEKLIIYPDKLKKGGKVIINES